MNIIDTHCHICSEKLLPLHEEILKECSELNMEIIEVGYTLESSESAIRLAATNKDIYASVGIHPSEYTAEKPEELYSRLYSLSLSPKVIAVGEIGLDFYWQSPKSFQYQILELQLDLAKKRSLPVIFHVRQAYHEFYEFIKPYNFLSENAVLHCFSSDVSWARSFLNLGFYLGFDGPVTYPKNDALREVLTFCPHEKILCETDCPYMPPVPYRGKTNRPAYIVEIIKKISSIKNMNISEMSDILYKNAHRLFKIDPS